MLSLCILLIDYFYAQNDSTYFQLPDKKKERKEKNREWLDHITYGGNIALFSSQRYAFVDISPLIGYHISTPLMIAIGPVYTYYSEKMGTIKYKFDMYGVRILARVYVLQNFFLQTGWDKLNRSIYVLQNNIPTESRIWIDNLWIGGGVKYPVSSNGYMFSSILFNLKQNNYSPYPNPYVQIGFMGGL